MMRGVVCGLLFMLALPLYAQSPIDSARSVLDTPVRELNGVVVHSVDGLSAELRSAVDGLVFQEAPTIDQPVVSELEDAVDAVRRRCRVLDAQLVLRFVAEKPARFLKQDQQLLLQCPKGMRFRLGLLQAGVGVHRAMVHWRDADDQRRPAYLDFVLSNGQPLARTVFESDGQPFQVSFVALLHAAGDQPMVGVLETPGALSIRVVPE